MTYGYLRKAYGVDANPGQRITKDGEAAAHQAGAEVAT